MSKKLDITKGKWEEASIESTVIVISPQPSAIKFNVQVDNNKLTADAGNTYNECNMLPSELLKQRDDLLRFLKVAKINLNDANILIRANKLIKQIENESKTTKEG